MDQRQKNARKMYTNVLQFFLHAGAVLPKIKKIKELVEQATADVAALDAEALRQPADTTAVTRTRTEVKKEAAEKAEALRGLVLGLSDDDKWLAALRKPVSGYLYGADAACLTYCQQVVKGVDTLNKSELEDAGYALLGEASPETNVLFLQTSELAAGGWRVKGQAMGVNSGYGPKPQRGNMLAVNPATKE